MRIRKKPSPEALGLTHMDVYVLGEVVGPFLGGIIFFLFIFLMFQALRLVDQFIVHGVSTGVMLKMVFLLSLSFMPFAVPVAFLIAVLIGFGRLSADSELVAFKASGFSLLRMAAPVAVLSVAVASICLFLNTNWVPWGDRAFKQLLVKVGNTKVVSSVKEGAFTTGFFDLLIFADKVDTKNDRLSHVFIYDEREPKNAQTIVAQAGEILPVHTGSELGSAVLLKLKNGSIHRNDIEAYTYHKTDFGFYSLYLSVPEGADTTVEKPQMIPQSELVQKIKKTNILSWIGREYRGEYWRRYAVALSPMIFTFLGIGFGTVRTRSVRAGAVLIALGIMFIYWGAQTAAIIYGVQQAWVQPALAMQLPNLLALIGAFFSFRKAQW